MFKAIGKEIALLVLLKAKLDNTDEHGAGDLLDAVEASCKDILAAIKRARGCKC